MHLFSRVYSLVLHQAMTLLCVCIYLSGIVASNAESYTLDWSDYQDLSFEETNDGYTTTLENVDNSGVYISIDLSGDGLGSPPTIDGNGAGDEALYFQLDGAGNNESIQVNISFSDQNGNAVEVTNVSFTLFDIDEQNSKHGLQDVVSGISAGNELTGGQFDPEDVDAGKNIKYDKKDGSLTGKKPNDPNSEDHNNAEIDFGTDPLTELEFTYGYDWKNTKHHNNPSNEPLKIGLGDIHFDVPSPPTVPEYGTLSSLVLVFGAIYFVKRKKFK